MRTWCGEQLRRAGWLTVCVGLVVTSSPQDLSTARGGVIQFASKSTFLAQTDVAVSGNLDDFGAGLNVLIPSPFTRAGITWTEASYSIGANTVASNAIPPLIWNPVRNTTLFAYAARLSGNIETAPHQYSRFGFELGYLNNFVSATHPPTTATLALSTASPSGTANYSFTIAMPGSEESFAFSGFKTDDPLEYFTSFQIVGPTSYFPGISEWSLGDPKAPVSGVPEPGTLTLLALGGLAAVVKHRWRLDRRG